jgi:hypothetical protein
MRIAVVVFEGFDELDAIGPLEVLPNAAAMGDVDLQVDLVALDGAAEVTGSHGLRVRTDGRLDPDRADVVVVVPGGGWNDRAPQGPGPRPSGASCRRRSPPPTGPGRWSPPSAPAPCWPPRPA